MSNKYIADDGYVFDYKDLSAHQYEDENGNTIQEHLYGLILYLGINDSIDNYQQVARYETYDASDGFVFDYKDADERGEHLYVKQITIDRTSHENFDDLYVAIRVK
jgi:hypothetical protein